MSTTRMWLAGCLCSLSILLVCRAVPINRSITSSERHLYIDRSNEKFGNESVCVFDDVLYKEGDPIPSASLCERCTCRPPGYACESVKCEMKPGCRALQRSNQCCPEYQCECERNGRIYQNGERLEDPDSPCKVCYCQSGEIVCTVIECYRRADCEPRYVPGKCCPKYDHCPPIDPTPMTFYTTSASTSGEVHTSSREYDTEIEETPYTSEHTQDNVVDSTRKIELLEEMMGDGPLPEPTSSEDYGEHVTSKEFSAEASTHHEHNREELHQDDTELNTEAITNSAELVTMHSTEEDTMNTNSNEHNPSDFETHQVMFDNTETDVTQRGDSKEEVTTENFDVSDLSKIKRNDITSTEDDASEKFTDPTTVPTHSSSKEIDAVHDDTVNDSSMLKDGGSKWYFGDVRETASALVIDEKSEETDYKTTKSSTEDSNTEGSGTEITDDVAKEGAVTSTEGSGEETQTEYSTTHKTNDDDENKSAKSDSESNSHESREVEETNSYTSTSDPTESHSDENNHDVNRTADTTVTSTEYSVPVVMIQNDMPDHTMDIVLPDSESSSIHSIENKPENDDQEEKSVINEETHNSDESYDTSTDTSTTESVTESESVGKITSENVQQDTSKINEYGNTSGEENDSTVKSSSMNSNTMSVNDETTTLNVLEGEHPMKRMGSSEKFYPTTELNTMSENDEATTPNVLEGEHPIKRMGSSEEFYPTTELNTMSGNDETTTPNVLEGEHPIKIMGSSEEFYPTTELTESTVNGKDSEITTESSVHLRSNDNSEYTDAKNLQNDEQKDKSYVSVNESNEGTEEHPESITESTTISGHFSTGNGNSDEQNISGMKDEELTTTTEDTETTTVSGRSEDDTGMYSTTEKLRSESETEKENLKIESNSDVSEKIKILSEAVAFKNNKTGSSEVSGNSSESLDQGGEKLPEEWLKNGQSSAETTTEIEREDSEATSNQKVSGTDQSTGSDEMKNSDESVHTEKNIHSEGMLDSISTTDSSEISDKTNAPSTEDTIEDSDLNPAIASYKKSEEFSKERESSGEADTGITTSTDSTLNSQSQEDLDVTSGEHEISPKVSYNSRESQASFNEGSFSLRSNEKHSGELYYWNSDDEEAKKEPVSFNKDPSEESYGEKSSITLKDIKPVHSSMNSDFYPENSAYFFNSHESYGFGDYFASSVSNHDSNDTEMSNEVLSTHSSLPEDNTQETETVNSSEEQSTEDLKNYTTSEKLNETTTVSSREYDQTDNQPQNTRNVTTTNPDEITYSTTTPRSLESFEKSEETSKFSRKESHHSLEESEYTNSKDTDSEINVPEVKYSQHPIKEVDHSDYAEASSLMME